MASGLAAGLADGIQNGIQFGLQNQYYNNRNEHWENMDALRQQQADAKAAAKGEKGPDREGFISSLIPVFKGESIKPTSAAPQQRLVMENPCGLASFKQANGMIPDAAFSGSAPAAYQAGSLASLPAAQKQAEPAQPDGDFNPIHEIVKQVGFRRSGKPTG
ncbi:hypothetical protein [Nitrosovibrio tenuis]|uniref:Uncharacterized protein n=1 Tax=Nitrosovibrio tenuis TaxID=1233 RepID=A0A1H7NSQ6_9PROT|nr:hypothetical protein [Nitrosovibrio tenuis]SEL26027.1 hypothetical protein SAMN05216387_107109 [Nitrosovibrio tenuis]